MINLKDYIARDRIAFVEARDKQDALAKLIALSDDPRHVIDFEQFQTAVLDREYIVTTGIGQNVAIPHIKSRWVKDFFITIGVFRDGVEWQSLDEKPVHLAFLIAGPEEHESSSSLYTWSAVSAWMIALRFSLFLMMSVSLARMRR